VCSLTLGSDRFQLPSEPVFGDRLSAGGWSKEATESLGCFFSASESTFCHDVQNYDKGASVRAVLIENVFPVGVTNELLDAVTDEMGVDAELPPGGVLHVHFEKGGRSPGVDVWDSVDAYQQFVQSTLVPAMGKVATARGLDPSKMGEPEVTITEVHRIVH